MSILGKLAGAARAIGRHVTFSTEPNVGDTPDMARFAVDRQGGFRTTEEKLKGHDEAIASLQKQNADLRAIVNRIGKESKEAPRHARSAADLRQFVKSTEEE